MTRPIPPALVVAALSACGVRDVSPVNSGTYVAVDVILPNEATDPALDEVQLVVDRAAGSVTVRTVDGGEDVLGVVELPEERWPLACPTQMSSVRVELLPLDVDTLSVEGHDFDEPALLAGCGMEGAAADVTLSHASDETLGPRASCGELGCITFELE